MNVSHPLQALCQQSMRLLDLLLQERQALQDNHLTTLTGLLSQKEDCVQALMQLEIGFREQVQREGFNLDTDGISAWLERQRYSQLPWTQLKAILQVVRDLNGINGTVISRAERNTQRLLEIITGQPQVNTYRANGLHSASQLSRAYGRA
ncbi:MAG: flagellar protein FlgN [Pseudomonadales bacterium]|nr:flagellar protein FlgN [Pseudomonadales bacterium]